MAVVAHSVEDVVRAGLAATYTGSLSTSDTYTFPNDGKTILHVKKTGAGECTVTIVTQSTVDGQAVADRTVSVPATTGDRFIGPFPREQYNDANGLCTVSFSEITGLSYARLRIS